MMTWKEELPLCAFDFTEGDIPRRLPLAVKETLDRAGKPQREYVEKLRSYAGQKNLHNQRHIHHLKIARRFVRIAPMRDGVPDWTTLYEIVGPHEFGEYIPGVVPPDAVWKTLQDLRKREPMLAAEFAAVVNDLIDEGVETTGTYFNTLVTYRYVLQDYEPVKPTRRPPKRHYRWRDQRKQSKGYVAQRQPTQSHPVPATKETPPF